MTWKKWGILMKLLFKQRFFSWLDSYDIFNEAGETVFTVKGQLSWGHCLKILDAMDRELGTVKERIFSTTLSINLTINFFNEFNLTHLILLPA